MKKIVTFFAMAAFVVALSSCGNKSAESTEGGADSTASTMEAAPAADTTVTNTMESTDSTQHMSSDTTIKK